MAASQEYMDKMQLRQNYRNFWHTDLMGTIQADTPCIFSLSLSLLLSLCTNTDMHCFVYMYVCMCMEFLFCWYGCVFLCVCLCRLLPCVFLVSAISISWIWILSLNLWISIVLWISEFLRGCFDFDLVFWLWLTSWIRFDLCEIFECYLIPASLMIWTDGWVYWPRH